MERAIIMVVPTTKLLRVYSCLSNAATSQATHVTPDGPGCRVIAATIIDTTAPLFAEYDTCHRYIHTSCR